MLLFILAATMALEAAVGFLLRLGSEQYKDSPAMAVPFLMLRDGGNKRPSHTTGTPTQPGGTELPTSPPTQPEETTAPTEAPAPTETTPTVPSETTAPLAVYGEDEHYFDDALFIGDSRMEALALYARLGDADYFTSVGMSVFKLFSQECYDDNFSTTDLTGLLQSRSYGKIFMMLGINESGYSFGALEDAYREDVEEIRRLQPNAKIFLLKIYGVSRGQAEGRDYLGPENLTKVNNMIESLCDGQTIICLDPRSLYEDADGYLRDECSGDGIHPYAKELATFDEWLCRSAQ